MFPISRDETILLSHYLYIKPRPDFGDKFSAFLGIIDNIFGASFFIVFISVHAARWNTAWVVWKTKLDDIIISAR